MGEVIPVRWFLTHKRPDIDEEVARCLAILFGEKHFSGITPGTELRECGIPNLDGKAAEKTGVIMLGIGQHRFDEHTGADMPGRPGECAATLMARFLGILDMPALQRLFALVKANDLHGQGSPFDIGTLPKTMYEFMDGKDVVSWMDTAVRAVIHAESSGKPFDPQEGLYMFDRTVAAWLYNTFGEKETTGGKVLDGDELVKYVFGSKQLVATDMAKTLSVEEDKALQFILKYLRAPANGESMFDLKGLPALIYAMDPQDPMKAINWLFAGLNAKFQDQTTFLEAVEKFKADVVAGKIEIKEVRTSRGRKIKIAIINNCTNRQMNKAGRYCGMDMVIQRQLPGHVQIFTNKASRLDLSELAAMIRIEEQKATGQSVTWNWNQLRLEGTVPGVTNWFYHREGQMLLNGTPKLDQPATKILLSKILWLVEIALGQGDVSCEGSCNKSCAWHAWGLDRCHQRRHQR